jgi:Antitoxin-like ribbon-helix-helix
MMDGDRRPWLDRLRALRRTQPAPEPSQRYRRPPSREALRASTFYQSPEAWRQLKLIAFEQGTSQQALLGEALNTLFARYGRPPVAVGLAEPPAVEG